MMYLWSTEIEGKDILKGGVIFWDGPRELAWNEVGDVEGKNRCSDDGLKGDDGHEKIDFFGVKVDKSSCYSWPASIFDLNLNGVVCH